jgi:hypothetical protein
MFKTALAIPLILVTVVAIGGAFWRSPSAAKPARRQAVEIVTNQLLAVAGVVPVEIVDAKITDEVLPGDKPSPYGSLKFGVKNNTAKPMNAVVVNVALDAVRHDGSISKNSAVYTLNQAIHPDIVAHHGQKPIAPGQVFTFAPDPLDLASTLVGVKSITLSVDYADFTDGSALGPNTKGTERVLDVRRGAVKFKAWLVDQYRQSGKSEAATVQLLRTAQGPTLVGSESQGAKMYRKHLLDAYKMHGPAALSQFLEVNQ